MTGTTKTESNVVPRRRADDWKPAKPDAAERLREAVMSMDQLSQSGFERIEGLARIALLALESPEGHRNFGALASALTTIGMIAEDAMNCINTEAGSVGCAYEDKAWKRRFDAGFAFRDTLRAGVAA